MLGVLAVVVSGCSSDASTPGAHSTAAAGSATPTPAPISLDVTPADGSSGVGLDQAVTVSASNAVINTVRIEENGAPISLGGTVSSNDEQWQYQGGLAVDATYTVTAVANNQEGSEATATATFSTITSAKRLLSTVEYLTDGQTVGVGMPIELHFNADIPPAEQQNVLAHIAVVSNPAQPGGWYWFAPNEVHYRPQSWWQPGTQVTVDAELNGVDAGNGYWGMGDWSLGFTVGAEHVTLVNTQTRIMQVYNGDPSAGGQLLYTWPTNTGKPGFYTINGTLVVLYHSPVVKMQSCPTFETPAACIPGGSQYYDENVYLDTAISSDGYFIHSAPWACQGNTCNLVYPYGRNTSHGCVNLSPQHAQSYYSWSQPGDVVEVSGSPLTASFSDGEGDWQTPWSDFVQGGQDVAAAVTPAASPSSTASAGSSPAATPTPVAGRP